MLLEEGSQHPAIRACVHSCASGAGKTPHTSSSKAHVGTALGLFLPRGSLSQSLQSLSARIWSEVHTEAAEGSGAMLSEVENPAAMIAAASRRQSCRGCYLPAAKSHLGIRPRKGQSG